MSDLRALKEDVKKPSSCGHVCNFLISRETMQNNFKSFQLHIFTFQDILHLFSFRKKKHL